MPLRRYGINPCDVLAAAGLAALAIPALAAAETTVATATSADDTVSIEYALRQVSDTEARIEYRTLCEGTTVLGRGRIAIFVLREGAQPQAYFGADTCSTETGWNPLVDPTPDPFETITVPNITATDVDDTVFIVGAVEMGDDAAPTPWDELPEDTTEPMATAIYDSFDEVMDGLGAA